MASITTLCRGTRMMRHPQTSLMRPTIVNSMSSNSAYSNRNGVKIQLLPPKEPLKIVLFASDDAKGCITANLITQAFAFQGHRVALIISPTDRPAATKRKRNMQARLGRYETEFFTKYLSPWVERLPASVRGTNRMKTFNELAEDLELIRLDHGQNVNDPGIVSALRAAKPDVMISARFQQIFKEELLGVPSRGMWNIHPGEVHKFKGVHPDLQAMRVGAKQVGMVMHSVDEGIDTGKIHSTVFIDPYQHSSLLSFRTQQAAVIAEQCNRLVAEMAGLLPETVLSEHPPGEGDYYSWPTLAQHGAFEEKHSYVEDACLVDLMHLFSNKMLPADFVKAFKAGQLEDDVTAATEVGKAGMMALEAGATEIEMAVARELEDEAKTSQVDMIHNMIRNIIPTSPSFVPTSPLFNRPSVL